MDLFTEVFIKQERKKNFKERFAENYSMLKEIYTLIKINKKWWLLPIFGVLAFLSFFMLMAGGSSILPAIYALF
ncbi:MAG: hypothetical protein HN509_02730 [Halobacteriovoraceae bacterium]|jgi:hypothetical protein|nr:hypothetical protein [Halobacteriovoraceae bacterium]MBT5094077.1 hypothetical protein [Halobacteriovoraceae bacterium]